MPGLRLLDLIVVIAYMASMVCMGIYFSRRQTSTEAYFLAKRSIPSWAMGISLFATLITSVTYIAYPGSAYAKDWGNLVPGFMILVVLMLVGAVIVPFYREAVGMSAYEYFGKRFGKVARLYSSLAFALAHFSKMGFIFYLLALVVSSMTGWPLNQVIIWVGAVTIFYSLIGGIEAVIWTEVIQGVLKSTGAIICLAWLFVKMPGGPSAGFRLAWDNGKFSLGSLSLDFTQPTIIVLILYGFFWYMQKYVADQTVVQRYLVAKSHRDALKGISLGAFLCVPVWALFMLVGTMLWSFFRLTGDKLPSHITKADQVFPHFLSTYIPEGLAGLFIAALMAAAMSGLASDLNCLAVVCVEDFYGFFKSGTSDQKRLKLAKVIVGAAGMLAVATGLLLAHSQGTMLNMWFTVSSIVSGGLAGLFLLAFLSKRANRQGLYVGITACIVFTGYATLTLGSKPVMDLGRFNFRLHEFMIGVIGHLIILIVGYVASLFFPSCTSAAEGDLTLWGWLRKRKALRMSLHS
jgi:SSS family solute:Na+ symporter